eukprot:CAMPEP_0168441914 /NCGR_PEP_ID=MMETSP0228-20121227/43738_1 /TAXON_ID=133427 /ORGANISM="Protoceratium reticulatum, Strain CCCM 535 (=CCMP 1889)" /LENGTH=36 /DNA_ID= /DNA_START= /DNA_END= /DNA_ORIENTATION=
MLLPSTAKEALLQLADDVRLPDAAGEADPPRLAQPP